MSLKIHVIANPVSGRPFPILHTLQKTFASSECEWDLSITRPGTNKEIIQKALASDADVIAVYGGDGTISEVASSMQSSKKILGILPGGSANVLAVDLGIPMDIEAACQLLCKKNKVVQIDAAKANDAFFVLRAGFGFEAQFVKTAERSVKNQIGQLAYALSGFQAFIETNAAVYEVEIDGKKFRCTGFALLVANSGSLGFPGFKMINEMDVSDGLLDAVLVRPADITQIFDFENAEEGFKLPHPLFEHWQGKEINVRVKPEQAFQIDGEVCEGNKLKAKIIPNALSVLVPESS